MTLIKFNVFLMFTELVGKKAPSPRLVENSVKIYESRIFFYCKNLIYLKLDNNICFHNQKEPFQEYGNGGLVMHFLTKIINGQVDDEVHRKFVKFSTGEFEGPTILVNVKKKTINFKASFDYHDFVMEFIINRAPSTECSVKGNIFSSQDISEELKKIGVKMKKSKNVYKAAVKTTVSSEKLRELYAGIGDKSTLLLSINPSSGSWKLAMKANFPKPITAEVKDPTSFCNGFLEGNGNVLEDIRRELAPDFVKEIPLPFTSLRLTNLYHIVELVFPEDKDKLPPREVRVKTKRKGTLSRILEVDGQKFKKEIPFIV